uniref:Uncharacterized protein n=1 Tax=Pseudodiaptomus poplesia TaxID=213370 RepID=A0A0U2UP95_9MAXI|nr:hypothetical protein [Pseudodiaptomus poplesia]
MRIYAVLTVVFIISTTQAKKFIVETSDGGPDGPGQPDPGLQVTFRGSGLDYSYSDYNGDGGGSISCGSTNCNNSFANNNDYAGDACCNSNNVQINNNSGSGSGSGSGNGNGNGHGHHHGGGGGGAGS